MSFVVAVIVLVAVSVGGVAGGVWRITGALARQADRVGVGALRGGLLLNRFRVPLLLWAAAFLALGVLLGVVWVEHAPVLVALLVGAAVAFVALVVLPKRAPAALVALLRRLRGRVLRRRR